MNHKLTAIVIGVDLIILNVLLLAFHRLGWIVCSTSLWTAAHLFYFISIQVFRPMAHTHFVRVDQILSRIIQTVLFMMLLIFIYARMDELVSIRPLHYLYIALSLLIGLFYGRYFVKSLLRYLRARGRNRRTAVYVGAGVNLSYLYQVMAADLSSGYKVLGYFEDHRSTHLPDDLLRLGGLSEVLPWLSQHQVEELYCNLPTARSEQIVQIIDYCEKHFIRFYSVPNVHNYVHRSMVVKMVDDMPVLTLRHVPLSDGFNCFIKRTFDVIVSFLFLVLCFWWIAGIVALITKLTKPGPIFFRQKRNGYMGEEFYCLKFRSMRVNADADRLQATKDDPRTTRWGSIMRKTNIDELPQFINVLRGEMSVVGPRPHMVKHTEEYSRLIDKYMLRHWVKPGVTGWAQVRGARGETEHLWQMEDRIQKDVWYIENWSLWLDLRIIYLTVRNVIFGDKQAY